MRMEGREISRMVHVHANAGEAKNCRFDARAPRRREMWQETVVPEAERHRIRRRHQDGVRATLIV